ncbi:LysE family translocator [Ahrensia marina]|uniref:Threonine transporter n=1 Tax=Ahrensia marina TaxID=1514904 RepID=A0A0M9GMQ6_9HYPH|nr:LysE family translocator [Ahrensia marina]KPB01086.1 threonine transporter [Ahrensia marina]
MDWFLPFLPGFIAAFSIQAVAVASPGPSVALILGLALSQGRLAAIIASLGIALGSSMIATATILGLGLVMEQVAWLSTVLRFIGAAYLLWLAYQAWRKAIAPPQVKVADVSSKTNLYAAFIKGFSIQITNPKAIVFWMAIATVGATNGAPVPVIMLFVATAFTVSLGGHGLYALLLSSFPFRLAYDKARRWIEAAIGGFLAYVAFRLVTEKV